MHGYAFRSSAVIPAILEREHFVAIGSRRPHSRLELCKATLGECAPHLAHRHRDLDTGPGLAVEFAMRRQNEPRRANPPGGTAAIRC